MNRFLLIPFALFALVISCAKSEGEGATSERAFNDAYPHALYTYITKEAPYSNYASRSAGLQKGGCPHGAYYRVFVNDIARDAEEAGAATLPSGAILVKENYDEGKTFSSLTVMEKRESYSPEGGDWYWVKYGKKGEALESGMPAKCIGCHSKSGSEYRFTK